MDKKVNVNYVSQFEEYTRIYKILRKKRFVKTKSGKLMFLVAMPKIMRRNNTYLFRKSGPHNIYYWKPSGNHIRYVLKDENNKIIYSYVFDKNKFYRVHAETFIDDFWKDKVKTSVFQIIGDKTSDEHAKALLSYRNSMPSWLQGQDEAIQRMIAENVEKEIENMDFPDEKGDIWFEISVGGPYGNQIRNEITGKKNIDRDFVYHAEIHVGKMDERSQSRRRRRSRRRSRRLSRRRSRRKSRRRSMSRRR